MADETTHVLSCKDEAEKLPISDLDLLCKLALMTDVFSFEFYNQLIVKRAENLDKVAETRNGLFHPLHCGSACEGLFLPYFTQTGSENTFSVDMDHMLVRKDIAVELEVTKRFSLSPNVSIQDSGFNGNRFARPAQHAGYFYLLPTEIFGMTDDLGNDIQWLKQHALSNVTFKGDCPAQLGVSPVHATLDVSSHTEVVDGPSVNVRETSAASDVLSDVVFALEVPDWSAISVQWVDRVRTCTWPDPELVSVITNSECHIVPVGRRTSHLSEYEWRLSFSLAEKLLAKSLSNVQRQTYCIVKTVIKYQLKDSDLEFKSYYLKTVMFWACERKSPAEWEDGGHPACIVFLLDQLIGWLRLGILPHYFLPENDIVDQIPAAKLSQLADLFSDLQQNLTQSIASVIDNWFYLPVPYDVSLPELLKRNHGQFVQSVVLNILTWFLNILLHSMCHEEIIHDHTVRRLRSFFSTEECRDLIGSTTDLSGTVLQDTQRFLLFLGNAIIWEDNKIKLSPDTVSGLILGVLNAAACVTHHIEEFPIQFMPISLTVEFLARLISLNFAEDLSTNGIHFVSTSTSPHRDGLCRLVGVVIQKYFLEELCSFGRIEKQKVRLDKINAVFSIAQITTILQEGNTPESKSQALHLAEIAAWFWTVKLESLKKQWQNLEYSECQEYVQYAEFDHWAERYRRFPAKLRNSMTVCLACVYSMSADGRIDSQTARADKATALELFGRVLAWIEGESHENTRHLARVIEVIKSSSDKHDVGDAFQSVIESHYTFEIVSFVRGSVATS